jgi:Rrf2 family protein
MITISKKVEYSLFLVGYLAKNNDKTSLKEVSQKLELPYRFLAQLASVLVREGLLESWEGKSGGYSLSPDWRKKNVYDLLVMLGENKHMVSCIGGNCSRRDVCASRKIWEKMETALIKELKKISLKSL